MCSIYYLAYIVFLLVIGTFRDLQAEEKVISLCDDIDGNDCTCVYTTDRKTAFPRLIVECKLLSLENFSANLPFPNDTNVIDLSYNSISRVDSVRTYTQLEELWISYNKINVLNNSPFSKFPNLQVLDLSHNIITQLEPNVFKQLSSLTQLDLGFNKLTTLPDGLMSPLVRLRELNLEYNNLGAFLSKYDNIFSSSLGLTAGITSLNLNKLELKSIKNDFFGDTGFLKELHLQDNLFREVPNVPSSVTHFDFSGNNVTVLDVRHLDYNSFKVVKLNRLRNLREVQNYAFYNMPDLEELYMDNCPKLRSLDSIVFGVVDPGEVILLRKFSLARSGIQSFNNTFFNLFKRIDYINLQNNPFACDCSILWLQLLNGSFHKPENMR